MIEQGSFSFDLQLQLLFLKTILSDTYGKTFSVNLIIATTKSTYRRGDMISIDSIVY